MRAVVQRVSRAQVSVDHVGRSEVVGGIATGLLVYLGIGSDDGEAEVRWMAAKVAGLRLFPDDRGRFDRSVTDVHGGVLLVSQFTLYGDTRRGRRPSFTGAASPEAAEPLIQGVIDRLRAEGLTVASGRFGAHMMVDAVNDGPVTIILDTADLEQSRDGR